jgi:membrane fusion protein (multidrug efflux system)
MSIVGGGYLRDFGNLCLGAVSFFLFAGQAFAQPAPPPAVGVTPVITQDIAPSFSNVGHVVAIQSVKIVARVTAFIDQVNVQQGSDVKAGEVLFSLQPEQYQAALLMAEAQLASAQAAVANAQLVYERAHALNQTGFQSQSSLDADIASRNEDQANMLAAQANVANARLNLSYCTIASPIDGRIGAVALTKGNLVSTSTGALATINQLDPIRVEFSVSTDSPILTAFQSDPSEQQFAISIDLPDGKPYPIKGKIAFLDNQVDSNTGTVNVYADFANPNGVLLPGAYVNVETAPSTPQLAVMVPVAEVQADQRGDFVLVLGQGNKIVQTPVTLGDQIDQDYVVKSGLSAGQQVITDGIQKVKNGEVVSPTVESAAQ